MGMAREKFWEKMTPGIQSQLDAMAPSQPYVPPPPLAADRNVAPSQGAASGKQVKSVNGSTAQKTVAPTGIAAGTIEPKADPLGGTI